MDESEERSVLFRYPKLTGNWPPPHGDTRWSANSESLSRRLRIVKAITARFGMISIVKLVRSICSDASTCASFHRLQEQKVFLELAEAGVAVGALGLYEAVMLSYQPVPARLAFR